MPTDRTTAGIVLGTLVHTVLMPGMVIVGFPYLLYGSNLDTPLPALPGLGLAGAALIVVGLAIGSWCTWEFIFSGRGTPNPLDPPRFLVAGGLYRYVRNPMYIGVLAIILGEGLWFGSLAIVLYTGVVFLVFNLFVFLYEEPTLRRMFGAAYEQYCTSVPRWWPRRSA